jgi:hypothetical protein
MKAYEVYKKLYNEDINIKTTEACPDMFEITDTALCITTNRTDEKVCEDCWNREISDERVDWLMECKRMCRLMGCE